MTMINNNIPMPQVQRQREDIENSSLSPMAAPQGTAFRGKEDDDDKNKTLKTVAFVTLAALGIGYLANSASKGKWNPFDGDWWKSAKDAAANTNSQDTKNATNAIVEATSSAPSSLATDLDQKKTRNISTTVERAMKKLAKEDEALQGKNITEFVGESISMGDSTINFVESKSGKYGLKVKIKDGDKKLTHVYYYNKNGEEIGDARYVLNETSGLTQKIKMDADGNVFKNNGAGKVSGVSVKGIKGSDGNAVMTDVEAQTLGQQKVFEAFRKDVAKGVAANEGEKQKTIYSAFANNNTETMKQLKAQNGWSDAQATNIRTSFLKKFATDSTTSGSEQLSAASAKEFLNKYSGKHVTITQKGREGEALVQAFNGATGILDHMTHFDSNTREITRYGVSASEALQKALKEEDVKNDPTKIFSMDGLRITGVDKKENGFIDSVEKFSVLKKDASSDKKLFETTKVKGATNTVDQLNGLGENAELFFTHGEHTVDIKDSSQIKLSGGKTLKKGLHTVITDVAPEGDTSWAKLDDQLTKTKAQQKAKTVTVKKTFQSKDSSNKPIELVSMKFENDTVNKELFKNITSADNASMRDRMHLQAMMEGANFADNKSGEIGTSIGHMLGNNEQLTIAYGADPAVAAGNASFAHDRTQAKALNSAYVKAMTGFDTLTGGNINATQFSSFATKYQPVSLSLGTLNSEGTRLASRSKQDKTGLTTEYEKYNSDGNVELEAKYDNENHKYEVKKYDTDKKLTEHKLTYDHEGTKEYAHYEVNNGISEDELKMNTAAHPLLESNHTAPRAGGTYTSTTLKAGANSFDEANEGDIIFTISGRQVGGAAALADVSLLKTDREGVVKVTGLKTTGEIFLKFDLDEKTDTLKIAEGSTAQLAQNAEYKFIIPNAKKVLSADIRDRDLVHITDVKTGSDIVPTWATGGDALTDGDSLTDDVIKANWAGLKGECANFKQGTAAGVGGAAATTADEHKAYLTHTYRTRWADVAMAGLQSGAARITH